MKEWDENKIEELLAQPYWIVDILPKQVPQDRAQQYAAVENWYLKTENLRHIRKAQAEVMIRLCGYYDLKVIMLEGNETEIIPTPSELELIITEGKGNLQILAESEETLITLDHEDTYFTVFSRSEELLKLLKRLVEGSGLFFWKPEEIGE